MELPISDPAVVERELDALGDGTRRRIVDLLLERPRAVGEIAAELPVSRPAVSKHLRVLEAAGLVSFVADGRRRVYAVRPAAIEALREHWDRLWDAALAGFIAFATEGEDMTDRLVVRKEVRVPRSREEAFTLFTDRIGAWWPTASHSLGGDAVVDVRFGSAVGDQIVEVREDGSTAAWGEILAWDPPERVRVLWAVSSGRPTTTWEATFSEDGDGTRLVLEHWGWEAHGDEAAAAAASYDEGWDPVLARLVDAAG
jgi:DNA-binding transcriptional ArsR family regulator